MIITTGNLISTRPVGQPLNRRYLARKKDPKRFVSSQTRGFAENATRYRTKPRNNNRVTEARPFGRSNVSTRLKNGGTSIADGATRAVVNELTNDRVTYIRDDVAGANRHDDGQMPTGILLSYGLLAPTEPAITDVALSRRGFESNRGHFSSQPRRSPPLSYCSAQLADNLGCMTGGSS